MLCPLCCAGSQSCRYPLCQLFLKPTLCRALPNLLLLRTFTSTHAKPQYIGSPYWLPPVFAFHVSRNRATAALAALVASAWIIWIFTVSNVVGFWVSIACMFRSFCLVCIYIIGPFVQNVNP